MCAAALASAAARAAAAAASAAAAAAAAAASPSSSAAAATSTNVVKASSGVPSGMSFTSPSVWAGEMNSINARVAWRGCFGSMFIKVTRAS